MAAFVWVGWGRRALLLLFLAILALVLGLARAAPTPQDVDREIRAGRYDQALVMLADVRKERPLSATAEWLTASALFGKGEVQEAGEHLAAARRLDPALTGAAPARVTQIEGALRGQERASFWRLVAGVLAVGVLGALVTLWVQRARRARQRKAERDEALDGLYRRVAARENEIESEQLGLKIAALTDRGAQAQVRALEDELNTLYGALSEVQDGPVEAMAAYPGPRPRKAQSASGAPSAPAPARPSSAPASSPRPAPAPHRSAPTSAPVTVMQGGSSGDLLTGVLLGQAMSPSAVPAPARPDPAPEPERRVEAAPATWDNPSSLTEDRNPSWEAPSSLSSGASYDNGSSSSSSSWGSSDSGSSSSSSSDSSSSSSSDSSSSSSSDSSSW